ncbi:MAG: hypothetical protein NVSMB42_24160 [Herpetosiphon sp.]
MPPKLEILSKAGSPTELLEQLQHTADELSLAPPQQEQHNAWGPIFASQQYDLRIAKKAGIDQYELWLMHKLQTTTPLRTKFRRRK